jgi:cyclopropane fatty-acyl-phospholipid synthase-like methyltransferase
MQRLGVGPVSRDPAVVRAFYDQLWSTEQPDLNRHERARFACVLELATRLQRPLPSILDAGCGVGKLSALLAHLGPVTGTDWSESGLEGARRRVPTARFVCLDLVRDDIGDLRESFGLTICSEVIEHVGRANRGLLVKRLRETLVRGGHLILTTPNRVRVESVREVLPSHQPEDDLLSLEETQEAIRESGLVVRVQVSAVFLEGFWEGSAQFRRLRSLLRRDYLGCDLVDRALRRTTRGLYSVIAAQKT